MASPSVLAYEQGKLAYQHKKFQDAIFQFSEAIRLKPENDVSLARCYNARGVVYFYLGEFRKVIKDCTQALELDQANSNYYNCRGNAYFSLGKFGKAAEDFSKAIELSPEASHGRYFNNRGSAYRRLKMFKEAISDYTRAIQIDAKNGNYYNNRGNTYFDMGEFQLAIDDFNQALTLEPYSPKTKLTLAQAHEALAQEKRMKNATEYQGIFSHLKSDKSSGKMRRKDRVSAVYVSPAGIEVTYTRGWRKQKHQQSVAWSEDMKIELMDESHVKLCLDKGRQTYVIITPCDAAAVEEELIGRITTKFASYSTACLVAQHEGVVNEYRAILKGINEANAQLQLFETIMAEASRQQQAFAKAEKFDEANKAQAQKKKIEQQVQQKKDYIDGETDRAESVRTKAEQEAGPVLDMVLIMQNRVRELYHSKVKGVKDKYKVEDLALEEQLIKMEALVARAKQLAAEVAKPVPRARAELPEYDFDEAGDDEEDWGDYEEKMSSSSKVAALASKPAPRKPTKEELAPQVGKKAEEAKAEEAAPAPAAAAADAPAGEQQSKDEDSGDESDWDDLENFELAHDFMPHASEIFMSVESAGGMVTIRPSSEAKGDAVPAAGGNAAEVVLVRRQSLTKLAKSQAASKEALSKLQERADQADVAEQEATRVAEELEATRQEIEALRTKMAETEASHGEAAEAEKGELVEEMARQQAQMQELLGSREQLGRALEDTRAQVQHLETERTMMMKETEEEREKARLAREEYEKRLAEMQAQQEEKLADLEKQREQMEALRKEQETAMMSLSQLRQHLAKSEKELANVNAEKRAREEEVNRLAQARVEDENLIKVMREQQAIEEQKRRELHNMIQEIKGNIRVYIRIRPLKEGKQEHKVFESVVGSDGRGLEVVAPAEVSDYSSRKKSKRWDFEFDRVFWEKAAQSEVFDEIGQLVQSALDGYKVCIFAYGQTGSGKTHTMEGPDGVTADSEHRGVIPRSLEHIFKHQDAMAKKGWKYTFQCSFLEIYNTQIRDLLGDGKPRKHDIRLVKQGSGKNAVNVPTVSDLTLVPVGGIGDLQPLLEKAKHNRSTAATDMNDRSSRSHSVFQLRINGTHAESGIASTGVLNLIDLAGSERLGKSGAVGQRKEETKAINSSLTCLGDVIAALASGAKHVPFRNSKLTYLLQDCFGNGSKTLMFINLSPEIDHIQESLCSLRFGAKVHDCHVGTAKKAVAKKKPRKK